MDATSWIGLWAILFVVTHLGMTARSIRPRLVAAMGERPYLGIYSLISFATLIPLTIEFFRNKHSGAMLWNLSGEATVRVFSITLMLLALVFVVGAFITPSPAGLAPNAKFEPRGMLKFTRQPLFVGLSLFGFAHMLMNGWVGDLLYFGSFPVVSIIGAWHQDQRKLVQLGDDYRKFREQTSILPGAALISGRIQLSAADLSIPALVVGVAATVLLLIAHQRIFGGNPLG